MEVALTMDQISLAVTAVSLLLVTYLVSLCIHRIYLSPVAHVPGPWLAKVTYW